MNLGRIGLLAFLVLMLPIRGMGATRVVQFAGLAISEATQTEVINLNNSIGCYVLIANAGNTAQTINRIEFLNLSTNAFEDSSGASVAQLHVRGGADQTNCHGQTLASGEACIARFTVTTSDVEGVTAPCVGRITVSDSAAAQPGSVIASGGLLMYQESMTRGGQFSGAIYMSGVHLDNPGANPAIAEHTDGSLPIAGTLPSGENYQMNMYCQKGCELYPGPGVATASECISICGGTSGIASMSSWNTHGIGPIIHPLETLVGTRAAHVPSTVTSSGNPAANTVNISGTVNETAPGSGVFNSNLLISAGQMVNPPNYAQALVYAPGHFTGGMVYEMTVGPFNRICSGMKAFFNEDGNDFRHAGAVDSHPFNKILSEGQTGFPPERLLCQHRHGFMDPFSSVGQSSSFPINSGNPF